MTTLVRPTSDEGRSEVSALSGSPDVALLTAGRDKPYALGLAGALVDRGIRFDFIGSGDVDSPWLHNHSLVNFLNLRGDQTEDASLVTKVIRVLSYYARLFCYAISARPKVFHILWNNKFEYFDRTALMLFYRLCGRKIVYTAHNVNMATRDGNDSFINRLTLKIQYGLADHVFVHTKPMSLELQTQFQVSPEKISVIPFGMNDTVPRSELTRAQARAKLGLGLDERVILFYGYVSPYKGLEYLVESLSRLPTGETRYRLVIAGQIKKNADEYWKNIEQEISLKELSSLVMSRIEFIPDDETEIYFKAADVLVLPYTFIFQSGVLFLAYNFGLPVLAADVGSLKENVVEGETGFVFRPRDPEDLARVILKFFDSDLYQELPSRRQVIRQFASERYSWGQAGTITAEVYKRVSPPIELNNSE